MKIIRHGVAAAVAVVAALAGVMFSTGVASAATSPIAACGGGSYYVQESVDLHGLGRVYLMYNGSTNCVVTWHSSALQGVPRYTYASVEQQGGSTIFDSGRYSSYAGPVKVSAAGHCVRYGGQIADGSGKIYGYESDWVHCG